jgi:hypothetical protein
MNTLFRVCSSEGFYASRLLACLIVADRISGLMKVLGGRRMIIVEPTTLSRHSINCPWRSAIYSLRSPENS